jgi:choice-of-anchor A domain-containing protein
VKGNYGIGPAGKTTFSDGASGIITDNLQYDPTAAYTGVTNMTVGGEVEDIDLTMAAIQARELSYRASQMTPTLVAGAITGTTVLNSTQAVNVVSVTDIHMDGQRTLTLNGGPTDSFIVNVSGGITLEGGSKILLSGGLDPSRVLFNVLGAAGVNFTGNSNAASGLILAPSSNILIKGSAQITGGVIGGGSYVKVGGQPTITQVPYYAGWSTMGGETSRLLKVDHRTGSVKLVMMLDREYDSLASPFSAGFYASSAGRLYLLDPSTGNEDLLAAAQDFQGLEFAGPRLYGFAAGTDRLTRIDAVTGSTGSAIDVAATDLRGIVFIRVEDDPKPKTGYD